MTQDHLMTNKTNTVFPLLFALLVYWLLTYMLLITSLQGTHEHFVYPLDDTYIHMAIAKHFINDGSWGVGQSGFSSSTSSPLWTLLIAMSYEVFGVNDWSPFILALLSGSLVICYCHQVLRDNTNSLRLLLLLIVISLLVPLPIMTLTGMEHVLQGLLALLLIYTAADYLSKTRFDFYSYMLLIGLANLLTITRYEGVLLVFSIVSLFLVRKRFWEGFLFAVTSLLSITIYGFISLSKGWHFLPNSVLLKGNMPSLTLEGIPVFLGRMITNFHSAPHVIVLLIACLISYLWLKNELKDRERLLIILSTLAAFAHMQFASVGWFFRYESYIVLVLGVVLMDMLNKYVFPGLSQLKGRDFYDYSMMILLLFLFLIQLSTRTGTAFNQYPQAVKNIYEQQYQMGLFINNYYQGKCVAANDIGAINYLANICIIDLYGLANMDVAKHRLNNSYGEKEINQVVLDNHVRVVIIYNTWFNGTIPDNWIEVGKWKISNNVVAGGDEVSFYAPDNTFDKSLINNLTEFSDTLPSTVAQSGIYVSP